MINLLFAAIMMLAGGALVGYGVLNDRPSPVIFGAFGLAYGMYVVIRSNRSNR